MTFSSTSHTSGVRRSTARLAVLTFTRNALIHQPLDDEGLEQLQRHFLGQAALIQLQARADHDNGTAGIVHALAQQVLTETALLAAQQVGQGS